MMSDVILVTLNYRVGALGFMCLKDKELNVPGNAGLKDQLLALKFVKNNIEQFGGDSNNITLFGQSAGGSSVSWHCVSERSKGLFNRAIIMSGCILNSWSLTPHRDWANRLARKLGYVGSENESEILEYLQKADPVKIVEFQKTLLKSDEIGKIAFSFAPHVESYITEDTFIPSNPLDLLRKAWSNDIDILIGGVADEGLMYLENIKDNPAILAYFNLNQVVPEVGLPVDSPVVIEFVENLRRIYYPTSNDPTKDELAFCKVCFSTQFIIHQHDNKSLYHLLFPDKD
jgi:cholinesterase